jgi:tRNA threonylcarbamoyladenosine modification (KEOPS) complex Cgi121 subunit
MTKNDMVTVIHVPNGVGLINPRILGFKPVSKLPSFKITDSNTIVTVTGVRDVSISDINETLKKLDKLVEGASYQIFDADKIAGAVHIYHAASNAEYAINNSLNISKSLSVETLLYAGCENQIKTAIKLLGVSTKTRNIAVTVFSETEDDLVAERIAESLGTIDNVVLEITPEKYESLKNLYSITETAIETLGLDNYEALLGLITEKGALISLNR